MYMCMFNCVYPCPCVRAFYLLRSVSRLKDLCSDLRCRLNHSACRSLPPPCARHRILFSLPAHVAYDFSTGAQFKRGPPAHHPLVSLTSPLRCRSTTATATATYHATTAVPLPLYHYHYPTLAHNLFISICCWRPLVAAATVFFSRATHRRLLLFPCSLILSHYSLIVSRYLCLGEYGRFSAILHIYNVNILYLYTVGNKRTKKKEKKTLVTGLQAHIILLLYQFVYTHRNVSCEPNLTGRLPCIPPLW